MIRRRQFWESALIVGFLTLDACKPPATQASSSSALAHDASTQGPRANDGDAASGLLAPPGTMAFGREIALSALRPYVLELVADTCMVLMAKATQAIEISVQSASLHTASFKVTTDPTMLPPSGLICLRRGDTLHLAAVGGSASVQLFTPAPLQHTL